MAKAKGLNIKVDADTIVYTSITKSGDNYNSARMVAKIADKTYMNISVEWEGDGIPSFAMDLMGTLQASESQAGKVATGREEDYAEYMERNVEVAATPKCPDCGTSCK